MRPLFTIHAGEYLVATEIERRFKRANVWVPVQDEGIDLLVSDRRNRRTVSLQVKFSRDFLVTHMASVFHKELRACGWWTLNREKLRTSPADYWVFVLLGFASRSVDYVIIPRAELWRRLRAISGRKKVVQVYLWVTETDQCWETRGLTRADQLRVANGTYSHRHRDLTPWLNNWGPVNKLNH